LRLLQTVPYYPPHWGGMETVASTVAKGLRNKGHTVNVITTQHQSCDQEVENSSFIHRVPINFKIFNTPVSLKAFSLFNALSQKADLVHSYAYPVFFSDLSASVASRRKLPFVLEWLIDPRQAPAYKENIIARLVTDFYMNSQGNKVFRTANAIVTPSEDYKRILSNFGVSEDKIKVIPCGVDTNVFNPSVLPMALSKEYDSLILYVGRISSQKGLDLLLAAFPEILKTHPNTLLVVVGLCDQLDYWKSLQIYLKDIASHVRFIGNITQNLLARYYKTADLVVFPSRYESFGMIPLEASAIGTPVISTYSGAVAEITKEVAFLVKDEDPSAIAKTVSFVLSDENLRKRTGSRATHLVVNRYSWLPILEKYEVLYNECIKMQNN
jgi:glycogen synthase